MATDGKFKNQMSLLDLILVGFGAINTGLLMPVFDDIEESVHDSVETTVLDTENKNIS